MKILTQYIFEKLRLNKGTNVDISDYINSNEIHKIKFNEFYKYINNTYTEIDLYITDVKNNSTLTPVKINTDHHDLRFYDKESDFIIYFDLSDNNELRTEDIQNIYDNTKKYGSVVFYIETKYGINSYYEKYIPFIIIEDYKVLHIYVCTDRDFNSIVTKRKLSDTKIQKEPELFDKHEEKTLMAKFDKQTQQMIASIPDKYKYRNKNGDATLFWKVYTTLLIYGPMSKTEVLEMINKILGTDLVTTSYSTTFAQWSSHNQIISVKRKLTSQPYSDWKI